MNLNFVRTLLAVLLLASGVGALAQPGSRDASFAPTASPDQEILNIARQTDGAIIAVGLFQNFGGRAYIARLSAGGALDAGFTAQPNGPVYCVALQSNGKLIIGGEFSAVNGTAAAGLARLNSDGSLDAGFTPPALSQSTRPEALLVQPDGRILVGGSFTDYGPYHANRIVRLNTDGSVDASFQSGEGFSNTVHQLLRQPDGKIIAVGSFYNYYNSSTGRGGIARLNPDGSNDDSFSPNGGAAGYGYRAVAAALQSDGKIVVGGSFSYFNNVQADHLARLNADGSRDMSFTGGANSDVYSLQVQPDDKILIGGLFSQLNGNTHPYFGRLLANGNPDPAFSATVEATNNYGYVNAVLLQPDSRILVAGLFSGYNGSPAGDIVRALNVLPTLTTGVTVSGMCAGSNVAVSYSINTDYDAGNTFTAQLSDANGSFTNAVNIGSVYTTGSATIGATIPSNTPAGNGYRIRVVASLPAFTGSDNGSDLGIAQLGQLNAIPNTALCAGTASAPISFSGGNVSSFSWTNSNPAIGLAASGSGNLPSFMPASEGSNPARATITVRADSYCPVKPVSFVLTVRPRPDVATVASQQLCAGSATAAIAFSGSLAGSSFAWTNNNTSVGLTGMGTGNIPSFSAQNNTGSAQTALVTVTPSAGGCTGDSRSFGITVSPSAGSISYAQASYCPAGSAYTMRSGSAGGTYTATPAGLSLNAATGQVNLALSAPGTYTVTYTVSALPGCNATASTQLTVNPQAGVNAVPNQTYCNGMSTAPITFSGTAASYTWSNDNTGIGLAASGTGNLPSFTTENAGPATQYAYIKVTPVGNASSTCTGKPISFRITVNYCPPVTQSGGTTGTDASQRLQASFTTSPNPARESVTLHYTGTEGGLFTARLLSASGTPLASTVLFSGNTCTLSLSGLLPGSYLVAITNVRTGISTYRQLVKL